MDERTVETVEEARQVIRDLRERYRSQAHQLMAWRRRVKQQEELVVRMTRERSEQLKTLSAQLLLFESRLCRKQKDLGALLAQRDSIIAKQQRTIQVLRSRLVDAGLEACDSPPPAPGSTNLDSLNDSDSAVIMEEGDGEPAWHCRRSSPAIVRSVSDALEQPKYPALRRSNGFLRRPEILETVYSVEEDGEGEQASAATSPVGTSCGQNTGTNSIAEGATAASAVVTPCGTEENAEEATGSGRLQGLYGSFERLHETPNSQQSPHSQVMTTYNRVMSNHRSVTKPKDVKYKRINKAKSKSLEELRGRLRNWVDKGNKLAVSLDQSYA